MSVKVTKTLDLSPAKLRELLIAMYANKAGIEPSQIKIDFKAGMDYGYMDRDPGSPTFTGVTITVEDSEEFDF